MKSKTFHGGVHPPEEKEYTEHLSFEIFPAPALIILPLSQHLGKTATPLVKKGAEVRAGMLVAQADGFISAPVHSPVNGKVKSVSRESHSGGFPKEAIVITPDEESTPEFMPILDPETVSAEEIRQRVKEAGIVGQGGAAFPTYVKLTPPEGKTIESVILNGCECEPYLTRDFRMMIEQPEAVIGGLKLMMKAIGVQTGVIGIEDNKPEAIEKMREYAAREKGISIVSLKTKYPQGAEKMLIKAVTGREVPPGKLPLDVGVVIQNIGTAVAVYEAVTQGKPQITAALTVTGKGVRNPKNLIVPVGSPIQDVIDFCGGMTEDAAKIIVGGPMMGVAQYDMTAPVMKATSGIVVLTRDEVKQQQETPCLRCGKCIEACPLNLMPTNLARFAQLNRFEDAEQLNVTVCMECGTCAFTCPANIPLVQWLRLGKQRVAQLQREREASSQG